MKKVFSHNLPVERVIYARGNGNREVTIIHISNSIHKEEFGKSPNTYWHTNCGKNIDWHNTPRPNEMQWAVANENDYKLCPHCCATLEGFMNAYAKEIEFDKQRRIEEDKKEEVERQERKERWNKMMTVLDEEACDVFENRKWHTDLERESVKYYTIKRNGTYYKVMLTIEAYDPSKDE